MPVTMPHGTGLVPGCSMRSASYHCGSRRGAICQAIRRVTQVSTTLPIAVSLLLSLLSHDALSVAYNLHRQFMPNGSPHFCKLVRVPFWIGATLRCKVGALLSKGVPYSPKGYLLFDRSILRFPASFQQKFYQTQTPIIATDNYRIMPAILRQSASD